MATQAQREEHYKKFDWTSNSKWQDYLSNVYPVPPMARLEKMKRKWYRTNIDKQFLVDAPAAESTSSST